MNMEQISLPELDSMELWLDSVRLDADPGEGLEKLKMHERWRSVLLADIRQSAEDGFLGYGLIGSAGAAGNALAEACAGTLARFGYQCFYALGAELEGDTPAETRARLDTLFSQSTLHPVCMIVGYVEDSEDPKALYKHLTVRLRRCIRQEERVVFLLLSQREEEVPASLRGLLQMIPLGMPEDPERQNLMDQLLDPAFDFNCRLELLEKTEGFDYCQLYNLINSANTWYDGQYNQGIRESRQTCQNAAFELAELLRRPQKEPSVLMQAAAPVAVQPVQPREMVYDVPSDIPKQPVIMGSDGEPMRPLADMLADQL